MRQLCESTRYLVRNTGGASVLDELFAIFFEGEAASPFNAFELLKDVLDSLLTLGLGEVVASA